MKIQGRDYMAYMCKLYSGKECDACGDCEEKIQPCPECGSEEYYKLLERDGEIIGCTDCIKEVWS